MANRKQSLPPAPARTRLLTIVAQDPGVRDSRKRILTTRVSVPAEDLAAGPRGHRVHVIDYDASTQTLYEPYSYSGPAADGEYLDPFENPSNRTILNDLRFHAQNVYAIVMRTLGRFEFALGRRVNWSFFGGGHQLIVAPHAFADANAFYSPRDQALMLGYFPGRKGMVFSCLSHDVIVHEATHALVHGLRARFMDPSSADQAAFHEGYADVVALLAVFSLKDVVAQVLSEGAASRGAGGNALIHEKKLTLEALRKGLLLGLADEMGRELAHTRGDALRRSVELTPSKRYLKEQEFEEPHRRGEVLVAAMMNSFLSVFVARLEGLGRVRGAYFDRDRVAEEAADAADYLMTMTIRALDYTPPVHIEFGDFLSALLTADREIRPDDSRYGFRRHLLRTFARYGIEPASCTADGLWEPPSVKLQYERTHFDALGRNGDEMFRFVWENRVALGLDERAFTRVLNVLPCTRVAPDDGFPLRETVSQCVQTIRVKARELHEFGITCPDGMPGDETVTLEGGVTLIFDEFGRVKFPVSNHIHGGPTVVRRQSARLAHLWRTKRWERGYSLGQRFSRLHRRRTIGQVFRPEERW